MSLRTVRGKTFDDFEREARVFNEVASHALSSIGTVPSSDVHTSLRYYFTMVDSLRSFILLHFPDLAPTSRPAPTSSLDGAVTSSLDSRERDYFSSQASFDFGFNDANYLLGLRARIEARLLEMEADNADFDPNHSPAQLSDGSLGDGEHRSVP